MSSPATVTSGWRISCTVAELPQSTRKRGPAPVSQSSMQQDNRFSVCLGGFRHKQLGIACCRGPSHIEYAFLVRACDDGVGSAMRATANGRDGLRVNGHWRLNLNGFCGDDTYRYWQRAAKEIKHLNLCLPVQGPSRYNLHLLSHLAF